MEREDVPERKKSTNTKIGTTLIGKGMDTHSIFLN